MIVLGGLGKNEKEIKKNDKNRKNNSRLELKLGMKKRRSLCSSVGSSVVYQYVHSLICLSIYMLFHLVRLFICSLICLFIHLSIRLSVHSSFSLPVYLSVSTYSPFVCLTIRSFVHSSVSLSICPFIRSLTRSSSSPPFHLFLNIEY